MILFFARFNGDSGRAERRRDSLIRGFSSISDMEAECFPTISMSSASNRVERSSSPLTSSSSTSTVILKRDNLVPEDNEYPEIKGEPISAPASPCQSSCNMVDDKSTITMMSPKSLQFPKSQLSHTSDSEEDDEEYYQVSNISRSIDTGRPVDKNTAT